MTTYYYFFCPALYRPESANAPDSSMLAFEVSTKRLIEYSLVCKENPPPNAYSNNYLTYTTKPDSSLVVVRHANGVLTPEGKEYLAHHPSMAELANQVGNVAYQNCIAPVAGKYFKAVPAKPKNDPLIQKDIADIKEILIKRTPATRAMITESLKILRVRDPDAPSSGPSAACVRRRQLPVAIVLADEYGLDLGTALAIAAKYR